MKKYTWILALLACAALLAACSQRRETLQKLISSRSDPVAERGPAVMAPTVEEKVVTMVPAVPRPDVEYPAAPPALSPEAIEKAEDHLRSLLDAPDLELAWKGQEPSPNATGYPAVVLADPYGNVYYISQDSLRPIEFTLVQPVGEAPGGAKSVEELRAAAEQIARTHSTRFGEMKAHFIYTEGGKVGNYFFRWELPGTDVSGRNMGMPAVLQIGLREDGTLFSYLNSVDLLP